MKSIKALSVAAFALVTVLAGARWATAAEAGVANDHDGGHVWLNDHDHDAGHVARDGHGHDGGHVSLNDHGHDAGHVARDGHGHDGGH
jgi:hypothetical protein